MAIRGLTRTFLALALTFSHLLTAGPPAAVKPCPPGPCEGPGGVCDRERCQGLADWIATGTISEVIHHPVERFKKDFAEFTFTVGQVEKGSVKPGQKLRFQVGWCSNDRGLPKETGGTFRFYGKNLPKDPADGNEYLDFEKAGTTPPAKKTSGN
jgi:hypothetical protein